MYHMKHWLSHRLLIQIYISIAVKGGGVDLAMNSGGKKAYHKIAVLPNI